MTIFGVGTMGSPVEMSQTTRSLKEPIEMFTRTRRARVLGLLADVLDLEAAEVELDAVIAFTAATR